MPAGTSTAADSDDLGTKAAPAHSETPADAAIGLRLSIVHSMVDQLTRELDPDVILQQALQAICRLNRWQSVGLSLPTADGLHWQTRAEDRMAPGEVGQLHPLNAGVVGRAYRTGQIQVVPDVRTDPDFFLGEGVAQVGSELVIPIMFDGQVIGAINLESAQPAAFDEDDVTFAQSIAQILAIALTNAQRFTSLQASEARHRLLFETMAQGVVYQAADGTIIDANPAAQRILGLTLDQLRGRTSLDPRWGAVHEDGTTSPGDTHPAMVALRTGQPVRDVVMGIDNPTTAERRWISITATPLVRAGEARPYQVYTTFDDITARKQTEEQLRQSEAQYRYLFEHNPHPMWAYDRQTLRFLAVNDAAVAKYGYTRAEFLRMTIADIRPPDDYERLRENLTKLRPTLQHSGRWRHRLKDGTLIDVEITSHTIQLFEREAALVVAQDVTARVRAETDLRASEELYRGLMESLDSMVTVVDAAGTFLYMNDVAARQFRGAPRDFIGKTMHELFPKPIAAAQLQRIRTALREDRRLATESRSVVPGQQRWHRTTIQPIHDAAGQPIYALVNASDIHDLKTTQQELLELNRTLEERVRERTAEVQDLYEHAPAGYHSLDTNGAVIHINQTELSWLGYTRDELLGRPLSDIMTQESRVTFQKYFPIFKERGWVRDLELELIRKDGSTFPVLLNATAIYNRAGAYVMSRSTVMDLTERKAADAALRQANAELARAARAKDEFLANMSHELRTPLNTIMGYSEILLDEIRGPLNPYQQTALRQIGASGQHLLALITDILDLSKVEAGRLDFQLESVQLAEVCQASLVFVKEQAVKKALMLDFHMNDHLAVMEADPKRLKQMLVNLLSNAVKFTPNEGWVQLEVVADAEGGVVRLVVQDTGIGIAPADLPRLFQPFVQLDSSLSRQHEGTGLGLSLVRRLAELHGGSVSVESEVGRGSRFTISLPYRQPRAADGPTAGEPLNERRSAAGLAPSPVLEANAEPSPARILLAEDNLESLQLIGDYLRARGYTVVVARDGEEAVGQAKEMRPDLILMDIQMPELDGLEATRSIRAAGLRDTPIIALTALAMPGDRERCLIAGANEYLTKPVNLRTLGTLVATWLERAAQEGSP